MPDVTNGTTRTRFSDLVKGYNQFEDDYGINFCFASVDVEGSGDTDNIGIPLVWNNTDSAFNIYDAQDISAVTGSPLPDGSPICIAVGAAEGRGFNRADTTLSSTAVKMTVMFRGPAAVVKEGFEWASTTETNQNEFYAQLEKQNIAVMESGTTVDPTFV